MKRLNVVLLLISLLLSIPSDPGPFVLAQTEPRFSYPGARRFRLTSYFDHSNPNYTVDGVLTIYTKERGRQELDVRIVTGLVGFGSAATIQNLTAVGGASTMTAIRRLITLFR
jgi:hypothetical protein